MLKDKRVRILMIVLALLGIMVASTARAQDAGDFVCPDGTGTVTVAAGAVGVELELAQAAAARYMALCPNITVEILETPDLATDRLGLYLQFLEAQSPDVDVYQIDVIWPGALAEHMVDLLQYASADDVAAHFPRIIENNTVDGALIGIPWFTDAPVLYYRQDLLDKYGVAVPTTWDELTLAAQTIQDGERAAGNPDFWGFVWQGNNYEGLTCDAHEWQVSNSGLVFVGNDLSVNVTNDATIAAFTRAAGWVGTISPDAVTTYAEEDSRAVFQAGNAAFMRNWPYAYALGNADDSAIKGLFDVSVLPMGDAGISTATLGGWQLSVSKYSDNVAAAASVALFLASYEEQKVRAVEASYNPTIMALYQDQDVLDAVPFFGSLYDVFTTATPRPSTVLGELYPQASVMYASAVHSILTGETDALTAMEDLEADLLDLIADLQP